MGGRRAFDVRGGANAKVRRIGIPACPLGVSCACTTSKKSPDCKPFLWLLLITISGSRLLSSKEMFNMT